MTGPEYGTHPLPGPSAASQGAGQEAAPPYLSMWPIPPKPPSKYEDAHGEEDNSWTLEEIDEYYELTGYPSRQPKPQDVIDWHGFDCRPQEQE